MSCSTLEKTWHEFRQTRSIRLRNKIATENDGLCFKVAHRWVNHCAEPLDDLAQLGRIGLLKAVERFDPTEGVAFSSFAIPYINGEIQHFLRDHWGSVKIPRRAFEQVAKVKKTQTKMAAAGRVITLDEAAAACGLSHSRWQWVSEATQRKQLATLDEILELADESDPMEWQQIHQYLLKAIAKLPSLQRRCLTEKFFNLLSEEAIAKQEQTSVAQIQTLLENAITKLRSELQEMYVDHH